MTTLRIDKDWEITGEMLDYYLMAEYDMEMIQDRQDYMMFIAGLYRRAGMQKSTYPKELFDVEDKSSGESHDAEQEEDAVRTE